MRIMVSPSMVIFLLKRRSFRNLTVAKKMMKASRCPYI